MKARIVTIGVYGFDEAGFFKALEDAGVNVFCDIRQRRGMRGKEYAFANSARLQARLKEMGIGYKHLKELGVSKELRALQYQKDKKLRIAKRKRTALDPDFIKAFKETYLSKFDSEEFIKAFGEENKVIALFCVEREPSACHRSIVAERLANDLGIQIEHIKP